MCGNASDAAEAVGVDRSLPYQVRRRSEAFDAAWREALLAYSALLEREADRRGLEGVERLRFTSKGQVIVDPRTGLPYVEKTYSDTLLLARLRALRPDIYRAPNDHPPAPTTVNHLAINYSDPATLAAIRALRDALFQADAASAQPRPELPGPEEP
jgi:hypothetical protein